MAEGVTVREGRAEDTQALTTLLAQLFAIEADFAIDPAVQARGLRLLGTRPDAVILVAEAEGRVVGMCTVQLTASTARGGLSAGIEDVVVDQVWRGRGVGRALLAAAEAWARGRGAVRLALLADETNLPALDFYDRLGFTRTRLVWLAKALD
ncbi:GNAT family N-acetyltransferase [Elioraea sp.]|uniref:GNAT family N-acetyltransferase n=1 Tax=Elioraea sp. TaxID=2185103 RepID=UPI0021DDE479|nr:GNAT family N-acetyltransferase [Elioraea sp.]GIX09496.1 MAG: acetyltransferase [Elioraea sp.]